MRQIPRIKYVIYADFVDDLNNCRNIKLYEAAPELLRAAVSFRDWFKTFFPNSYAEADIQELKELNAAIAAAEFHAPSAEPSASTPNPTPKAD